MIQLLWKTIWIQKKAKHVATYNPEISQRDKYVCSHTRKPIQGYLYELYFELPQTENNSNVSFNG